MGNFRFVVDIKTSDPIYDDAEIQEMMQNIADAVFNHIENSEKGITPEASEGYVEEFSVYSTDIDKRVERKVI
jgi:hypothetical protein